MILTDMTWPEVKEALKQTNVAIIPVGSCEQHSTHLPLNTDYILALERAKLIAKKTKALVVPVMFTGLSFHHMGFPGTISLKPDTIVRVLLDTADCLKVHGINKIVLLSAHGGNDVVLTYAAQQIKSEIGISAVFFGAGKMMSSFPEEYKDALDIHAGVLETAAMLIYEPSAVRMSKALKPKITIPQDLKLLFEEKGNKTISSKIVNLELPEIDNISDTGSVTFLDPSKAEEVVELRRKIEEIYIEEIVEFIRLWEQKK